MIDASTLNTIAESITFMNAADEAVKDKLCGKPAEFTCPICGRKAAAIKNTYNGHIHACYENFTLAARVAGAA